MFRSLHQFRRCNRLEKGSRLLRFWQVMRKVSQESRSFIVRLYRSHCFQRLVDNRTAIDLRLRLDEGDEQFGSGL